MAPLLDMIRDCHARRGGVSIVDVGGSRVYWNTIGRDFLEYHAVRIAVVNNNRSFMEADDAVFSFHLGDGCDLGRFADGQFDIAHSNSVIEHVGGWSRMAAFARELRRVGRACFVQTPNFWFPVEPHFAVPFVHWLPRPVMVHLIARHAIGNVRRAADLGEAYACIDGIRLLDRTMMTAHFPDCDIVPERFLGFTKSFIAVRTASPEGSAT